VKEKKWRRWQCRKERDESTRLVAPWSDRIVALAFFCPFLPAGGALTACAAQVLERALSAPSGMGTDNKNDSR